MLSAFSVMGLVVLPRLHATLLIALEEAGPGYTEA